MGRVIALFICWLESHGVFFLVLFVGLGKTFAPVSLAIWNRQWKIGAEPSRKRVGRCLWLLQAGACARVELRRGCVWSRWHSENLGRFTVSSLTRRAGQGRAGGTLPVCPWTRVLAVFLRNRPHLQRRRWTKAHAAVLTAVCPKAALAERSPQPCALSDAEHLHHQADKEVFQLKCGQVNESCTRLTVWEPLRHRTGMHLAMANRY